MLCRVTQTATTLNTGDHSFPNIEAHIYRAGECAAAIRRGRVHTCPLEYTCCVFAWYVSDGPEGGHGNARGAQATVSHPLLQTGRRATISDTERRI